jgi:hypothetical protein
MAIMVPEPCGVLTLRLTATMVLAPIGMLADLGHCRVTTPQAGERSYLGSGLLSISR